MPDMPEYSSFCKYMKTRHMGPIQKNDDKALVQICILLSVRLWCLFVFVCKVEINVRLHFSQPNIHLHESMAHVHFILGIIIHAVLHNDHGRISTPNNNQV